MKKMQISKFKETCLSVLENLDDALIIVKHGKPIAQITPLRSVSANLLGKYKNKINIKGDIFSTGIKWNAES